jgi:twitching motility two-component system response regulator PilG
MANINSMQGNLQEISFGSLLQLLEIEQLTGELILDSQQLNCPTWTIFLTNGRVVYATDNQQNGLLRLRDYLRYHSLDSNWVWVTEAFANKSDREEYECIWLLLDKQILSLASARQLIQNIIEEMIFEMLRIREGNFTYIRTSSLEPELFSLSINTVLSRSFRQLRLWKQLYPYVRSPQQCPIVADRARLKDKLSLRSCEILLECLDGKTSLSQISRYLNCDLTTFAYSIYPYLKNGAISLELN